MILHLHLPLAIWEVGARPNNEDAIYPKLGMATSTDRLFMVCDGVGGASKGEIASELVCQSMARYFQSYPVERSTGSYLQQALEVTQESIDQYLLRKPESKGMGTTLTLLHLHDAGATIAHAGDSRVYQIRNGGVHWKTEDHSLVNELVKRGVLEPEHAAHHPQAHVITRAIQGNSVRPTELEVHQLTDIKDGDYFFLCSDGILENITDEALAHVLGSERSDSEKIALIREKCLGNPNDNFSAYLIHILAVEGSSEHQSSQAQESDLEKTKLDPGALFQIKDAEVGEAVSPTFDPAPKSKPDAQAKVKTTPSGSPSLGTQLGYLLSGGLLAMACLGIGYWGLNQFSPKQGAAHIFTAPHVSPEPPLLPNEDLDSLSSPSSGLPES
ncbi:MAG: protein phosphatase 2C domain-containing protein [Bacteroidota bacterium]